MTAAPTATPTASPLRSWRNLSRDARAMAVAGALGATFGLYFYVELVSARSVWARDALAGACIGGSVGFFLAAAAPGRDRAWIRLAHAVARGVPLGALGGAIGLVAGEAVLDALRGGLLGRALSWGVLGLGIGAGLAAGPGWRGRIGHGVAGGGLGGLLGGGSFEAIRMAMGHRVELGQGLGIVVLGGGLGLALALAERVLRRAWVQVTRGRQEGRSYLLAGRATTLGLDERAGVGLFGDATVARLHATIEADPAPGGGYLLRGHAPADRTRVNGAAVDPAAAPVPLRDGDRIDLGQTSLVFRRR